MINNLMAEQNSLYVWILLAVIVIAFVVWMLFSNKKSKQRQKEYTEQLEAIGPGHKVKTIGGICGIVVEVCDDNTVIIETGSEQVGKSYIKMDKECIAQTDAKGPTQIAREEAEAAKEAEKRAKKEGKPVEPAENAEEAPADAPAPEEAPAQPEENGENK